MKAPAPAVTGCGRETPSGHAESTALRAERPASNVVAFPRRVPRCEHCGWFVPPGSATEELHHAQCVEPRQRREQNRRELAALAAEWRRQDRERLRKVRGVPVRKPAAPLPAPRVSRRQAVLRQALADAALHQALMALTRLPLAALERVAAGRSTLPKCAWKRLLAELDR